MLELMLWCGATQMVIRCRQVSKLAHNGQALLSLSLGVMHLPHGPSQPGSRFVQNTRFTGGRGWTNELHLFNLTNGM